MGRLDNKVCIITGASTGIGRATMERLASEGATVVGCARTQSKLEEALASALALGGRGNVFAGDLKQDGTAVALIADTVKRYGRVDVLINNAGVGWQYGIDNPGSMNAIHDTSPEWWNDVMGSNLYPYYSCTREALKQMISQGSGSIVHVASMAGLTGLYDGHTYTACKGAIVNLSRSIAITYAKDGIRSNVVAPGFVDTPMVEAVTPLFENAEVAARLAPIGRPADPAEIAAANAFFASDDSSYCSGSTLLVDGGCTARSFAL